MKAIMMSIRPEWVAKILNKEKTIEVRKRFPSDYVGWVYIYCTKDNNNCLFDFRDDEYAPDKFGCGKADKWYKQHYKLLNGKVIVRFWCKKVEEIKFETAPFDNNLIHWETKTLSMFNVCQKSCLSEKKLDNYLQRKKGYAIHITNLEIFDKPKEISELKKCQLLWCCEPHNCEKCRHALSLTRAPQSWCYIEI